MHPLTFSLKFKGKKYTKCEQSKRHELFLRAKRVCEYSPSSSLLKCTKCEQSECASNLRSDSVPLLLSRLLRVKRGFFLVTSSTGYGMNIYS